MLILPKLLVALVVLWSAVVVQSVYFIFTVLMHTPDFTCENETDFNSSTCEVCPNGPFTFDSNKTTLVTEWGMVCQKLNLITLPDSLFMARINLEKLYFMIIDKL